MTVLGLLILLIVIGVLLYLVNRSIPMDANVKTVINAVAILLVVLLVLSAFGLLAFLHTPVPQIR